MSWATAPWSSLESLWGSGWCLGDWRKGVQLRSPHGLSQGHARQHSQPGDTWLTQKAFPLHVRALKPLWALLPLRAPPGRPLLAQAGGGVKAGVPPSQQCHGAKEGPGLETRSSEPFYCGLIHFVLTTPRIKILRESGVTHLEFLLLLLKSEIKPTRHPEAGGEEPSRPRSLLRPGARGHRSATGRWAGEGGVSGVWLVSGGPVAGWLVVSALEGVSFGGSTWARNCPWSLELGARE